jgi:hypothetical protein
MPHYNVSPVVSPEIYDQAHFSNTLLYFLTRITFETLKKSQIFRPVSPLYTPVFRAWSNTES